MSLPVIVLTKDAVLPEQGMYFVVAKNGIFLRKENVVCTAFVSVPRISFLEEAKSSAVYRLPLIPVTLMAKVVVFFRQVFNEHETEAAVLIHWSEEKRTFIISCPPQTVTPTGVHYGSLDRFDGHLLVGSIHSHADMDASHSCIDEADEVAFDGVHVTVGQMDTPHFDVVSTLVVNGHRFPLDPEQVFAGVRTVEWQPEAQEMPRRQRPPSPHQFTLFGAKRRIAQLRKEAELLLDGREGPCLDVATDGRELEPTIYTPPPITLMDLSFPDGASWKDVQVPNGWMERVRPVIGRSSGRHGISLPRRNGSSGAGTVVNQTLARRGDES